MNPELLPRGAALLVAVAAATRGARPGALALLGAAGAAAGLGVFPRPLPDPVAAASGLLLSALGFGLLGGRTWPPLVGEALRATVPLSVAAGLTSGVVLRGAGGLAAAAGGCAVLASLALLGAEGSRANAQAGWRRVASWALSAALGAACLGGLLFAARHPALRQAAIPVAAAVAFAAWVPALVSERGRVARELSEEVALGIVPAEDVAVLMSPWRRWREGRFGRPDERRAYVRSALLLAVARHQQRHRSGEAVRLRQLEILTFRTRLRRAIEIRSGREAAAEADALG